MVQMINKFFNWTTDYQSGRFIATGLIVGVTWGWNLVILLKLLFGPEPNVSKHLLFHLLGLIPPLNLITVWL